MANFTPEEINEILAQFFDVVGKRQYVGARYVPTFGRKGEDNIQWDNTKPYEPLTIVLYQGNSYTSRTYVPVGVEIDNTDYWALTGDFNAQIELIKRDIADLDIRLQVNENDFEVIRNALPLASFREQTVKNYIDDENENQSVSLRDTLIPYPEETSKYGTNGQVLYTHGDGGTEWGAPVVPDAAQTATAVDSWLTEHPDVTTTVEDHSLTNVKWVRGDMSTYIMNPNEIKNTLQKTISGPSNGNYLMIDEIFKNVPSYQNAPNPTYTVASGRWHADTGAADSTANYHAIYDVAGYFSVAINTYSWSSCDTAFAVYDSSNNLIEYCSGFPNNDFSVIYIVPSNAKYIYIQLGSRNAPTNSRRIYNAIMTTKANTTLAQAIRNWAFYYGGATTNSLATSLANGIQSGLHLVSASAEDGAFTDGSYVLFCCQVAGVSGGFRNQVHIAFNPRTGQLAIRRVNASGVATDWVYSYVPDVDIPPFANASEVARFNFADYGNIKCAILTKPNTIYFSSAYRETKPETFHVVTTASSNMNPENVVTADYDLSFTIDNVEYNLSTFRDSIGGRLTINDIATLGDKIYMALRGGAGTPEPDGIGGALFVVDKNSMNVTQVFTSYERGCAIAIDSASNLLYWGVRYGGFYVYAIGADGTLTQRAYEAATDYENQFAQWFTVSGITYLAISGYTSGVHVYRYAGGVITEMLHFPFSDISVYANCFGVAYKAPYLYACVSLTNSGWRNTTDLIGGIATFDCTDPNNITYVGFSEIPKSELGIFPLYVDTTQSNAVTGFGDPHPAQALIAGNALYCLNNNLGTALFDITTDPSTPRFLRNIPTAFSFSLKAYKTLLITANFYGRRQYNETPYISIVDTYGVMDS